MNINIVTVNSGWVLQKIAERLYNSNKEVFSISYYEPKDNVDANLYIDIQNCFHNKSKTIDIGYFTHLHENNTDQLKQNLHWLKCDHIIHMCQKYYKAFEPFYEHNKMCVLPIVEKNNYPFKKIKLGIFQRGEYEGKGFHFMNKLCNSKIFENFKLIFVGKGWKETTDICSKNNIDYQLIENENYNEYNNLYELIDYLFIPSLWEGGPMSVIEAYSKGIPIISSNVGWISDFEVEHMFDPNNEIQLLEILKQIENKIFQRIKKVENLSYKKSGEEIIKIVKNIKKI